MKSHLLFTTLISSLSITTAVEADRDDILVADFEGDDYGAWKTTGEAFGPDVSDMPFPAVSRDVAQPSFAVP